MGLFSRKFSILKLIIGIVVAGIDLIFGLPFADIVHHW